MPRLPVSLLVSLLVPFPGLQAQPPQADSSALGKPGYLPSPAVTPDMIAKRSEEITSAADLNEATKTGLSELYRKALSSLVPHSTLFCVLSAARSGQMRGARVQE